MTRILKSSFKKFVEARNKKVHSGLEKNGFLVAVKVKSFALTRILNLMFKKVR